MGNWSCTTAISFCDTHTPIFLPFFHGTASYIVPFVFTVLHVAAATVGLDVLFYLYFIYYVTWLHIFNRFYRARLNMVFHLHFLGLFKCHVSLATDFASRGRIGIWTLMSIFMLMCYHFERAN